MSDDKYRDAEIINGDLLHILKDVAGVEKSIKRIGDVYEELGILVYEIQDKLDWINKRIDNVMER